MQAVLYVLDFLGGTTIGIAIRHFAWQSIRTHLPSWHHGSDGEPLGDPGARSDRLRGTQAPIRGDSSQPVDHTAPPVGHFPPEAPDTNQ